MGDEAGDACEGVVGYIDGCGFVCAGFYVSDVAGFQEDGKQDRAGVVADVVIVPGYVFGGIAEGAVGQVGVDVGVGVGVADP